MSYPVPSLQTAKVLKLLSLILIFIVAAIVILSTFAAVRFAWNGEGARVHLLR